MNNISLAVMTISVLIGSSIMYADATKPQTGEPVTVCPPEDELCIETSANDVCGTDRVTIKSAQSYTITEWDKNNKFKINISSYGTVYEHGTGLSVIVGEFSDTTTAQGFYDGKGATVVKQTTQVNCTDGTTDTIKYKVVVDKP